MLGASCVQETDSEQQIRYADLWRRLGGMLADGVLLVIVVLVLAPLAEIPYVGLFVVYPAAVIGVMVWSWRRGASPGMRSARIHLADAKTGAIPRPIRLIPRAVIALLFFAAVLVGGPLLLGFGLYSMMVGELGPPNEEHRVELSEFGALPYLVIAGILVSVIFANLWMVWDRRRQTLIDKLSGVVVLEDPTPLETASTGQQLPSESAQHSVS